MNAEFMAQRIEALERQVRQLNMEMSRHCSFPLTNGERCEARRGWPLAAGGAAVCLLAGLIAGMAGEDEKPKEIRASRIVVVDDAGRPRVVIGQDAKDVQRISRAAGITLYDKTGAERGGFSTMDDGTVVLGMDAPKGVGAAMPDRIGLRVEATGAAAISLINNQTGVPVRLISEAGGEGGIEFIDYDLAGKKAFIKRLNYKGEKVMEQNLGG